MATMVRDRMRRDVVTVTEGDDLATALQMMLWNGLRHLPVLRGGTLVGVLSERDVLQMRDPADAAWTVRGQVGDAMTQGAVVAHPREGLDQAAARMVKEKVGCLPVIEMGEVVGILTTTDLLAEVAWPEVPAEAPSGPNAGDLMTPDPIRAHPDDLLVDAATRMIQNGIRHLPVVNGDESVVGILSDRDVRTAMGNPMQYVSGEPVEDKLRHLRVSDVMTPEPRVVRADAPLRRLLTLLVDERLGAVPVVDAEDRLAGIVSYLDVLRMGTGRRTRRAAASGGA